jgi:hypothetical protein
MSLYQSVSLSPSEQSVSSSSSHLLLTFPTLLTAIPQHINISLDILDIQHSVKPFTSPLCDKLLCCYDAQWLNNTFIFLTWIHTEEDSQFSLQMVLVVLRILNIYVLDFCAVSVVWSVWLHGSFYSVLICGLMFEICGSVLIFQWPFSCYYPWTRLILKCIS